MFGGNRTQMRTALPIPLSMIAFAIAAATMSLHDELSRYVQAAPYILGVPDSGSVRVRSIVPKGEPLGFITDVEGRDEGDRRLYAATYSLAPLVLEKTTSRRFVIADFRHRSSIAPALRQHRLVVVEDLGNGFLLLAAR